MIPYIGFTEVHIGPLTIQVWGTFVALGVLLGAWLAARRAKAWGLSPDHVWRGAAWIVVSAFIGARILHVAAYEPLYYWQHPWESVMVWRGGFSIMGGFLGAVAGFAAFARRFRLPWPSYVDAFVYGLPLGIGCGRVGCFLIHDHPGTLTHTVLAVRYPNGETRHDLGLYESLHMFVLAAVFAMLSVRKRPPFFYATVFLVWYGVFRFFLDFLRQADATYAGLTPGQYGALFMVGGGIFLGLRQKKLEQRDPL